jgi:outer membrane protein assembly factor BamD
MKKLGLLILLAITLAGCSGVKDTLAIYRHQPASKIFHNAEKALAKGDSPVAVKGFEALDAIYPFGPYSQRGQLLSIYAYYMAGDDPSAVAAADRYTRLYPRGKNVDYAYYAKGVISQPQHYAWLQTVFGSDAAWRDLTDQKRAFMAFSQVVDLYPKSPYAKDALLRLRYLRNSFAWKSLEIADFYYKTKAYVAAANRASYVIKHYNGTMAVPKALALMVKSYRQLKLDRLANNSLMILKASYPKSEAYRHLS